MLKFLVKNQEIEIMEREIIAADQIAFVTLKFVFDGDWKKFHKVVQFSQCDETYNLVLGTDGNSCLLPAERKLLTAEKKKPSGTLTERFREPTVIVSIGFVSVVVCAIMLKWTCVERKTGVSIGYGFLIVCRIKSKIFLLRNKNNEFYHL